MPTDGHLTPNKVEVIFTHMKKYVGWWPCAMKTSYACASSPVFRALTCKPLACPAKGVYLSAFIKSWHTCAVMVTVLALCLGMGCVHVCVMHIGVNQPKDIPSLTAYQCILLPHCKGTSESSSTVEQDSVQASVKKPASASNKNQPASVELYFEP